jgi:hypothetical protein
MTTAVPAVFGLMERVVDERFSPPGYKSPQWTVTGETAVMRWESLGSVFTRASENGSGRTLVIHQPPPFLPLVEQLNAEGWRRGDSYLSGAPAWDLYAYIRDEATDAEVRVECAEFHDNWPGKNTVIPFFADPCPRPPPNMRSPKQMDAWAAEVREWERKCREGEW